MTQVRLSDEEPAPRHCCRSRHDRLAGTGRAKTIGSNRIERPPPDHPCLVCGSVGLRPRDRMLQPWACSAFDARQGGSREADR